MIVSLCMIASLRTIWYLPVADSLHIVLDLRPTRTVLATVSGHRVIDTRRLNHTGAPSPETLLAAVNVLRERAPLPLAGLALLWRPLVRLTGTVDRQVEHLAQALELTLNLPVRVLPAGASLALGEWLRQPPTGSIATGSMATGPLAVLALGPLVAGGVVVEGRAVRPLELDLAHLCVDPRGTPCPCGARGCLHLATSEIKLNEIAHDLSLAVVEPCSDDWQSVMYSDLAYRRGYLVTGAEVLVDRAAQALGVLTAHLVQHFGVVELRVRTRHADTWQLLAPKVTHTAATILGPHAPRIVAAAADEDAFWTGCVAGAYPP